MSTYAPSIKYLLCLLYLAEKKPAKAVILLEDLLQSPSALKRLDAPSIKVHLGQAYMALDRLHEASRVLEAVLPSIPTSQPSRLVHALSQLGICYLCLNQHSESLQRLLECEEILCKRPDLVVHPRRKYRIWTTLGNLLAANGRYREAEISLHRALEVLEALGEADSMDNAKVNLSLATVYMGISRQNEAIKALTLAKETYIRLEGPYCPELVPILTQMASVLETQQEYSAAFRCLSQALDVQKRLEGEYSESGLSIWFRLIDLHLQTGQSEQVIREIQALDGRKGRFSRLGQVMIETQVGTVLRGVGDLAGAVERYMKAL